MTRKEFMISFHHYLVEGLENYDILDYIEYGYESEKFKCWYFYENYEAFILNKEKGILISWYKLTHIGRSLYIVNNENSMWGVNETLRLLAKDIKENEC